MLSNIYFRVKYTIYMGFYCQSLMGVIDFPYVRTRPERVRMIPGYLLGGSGSDIVVSMLLDIERKTIAKRFPGLHGATLYWRGDKYFSQVRQLCSDPELVLLTKPFKPLEGGDAKSLRRLDPNRLELFASDFLDLSEIGQVRLIRKGSSLVGLTVEQASYFHYISTVYSMIRELHSTKEFLESIQYE